MHNDRRGLPDYNSLQCLTSSGQSSSPERLRKEDRFGADQWDLMLTPRGSTATRWWVHESGGKSRRQPDFMSDPFGPRRATKDV